MAVAFTDSFTDSASIIFALMVRIPFKWPARRWGNSSDTWCAGRWDIYVGRALERPLGTRLFEHTFDRLKGRWNRFSWFGLVNLSEDGKITDQGLKTVTANVSDIIITMEALLIEGLEPKQNRKRGDTSFKEIEYIQIEDPNIEEKRMQEAIFTKLLGRDKVNK